MAIHPASGAKAIRRWLPALLLGLLVTSVGLYLVVRNGSANQEGEMAVCSRGTIQEFVSERGVTRLPETVVLSMPFSARIEAIPWEEGTPVTEGQVLARIVPADVDTMLAEANAVVNRARAAIRTNADVSVEETALAQAQAYVESMESTVAAATARAGASEAQYKYAQRFHQRLEGLAKSGGASQDDLDRAETLEIQASLTYRQDRLIQAALTSCQAATNLLPQLIERYIARKKLVEAELQQQLAEAEARLRMVEENARRAVMKSPYNGVVLRRFVNQEQFLAAGSPLLELGRWQDLEAESDLLTQDAVNVRPGMPVQVFLGETEINAVTTGRVRKVYPAGFMKLSSLGVEEQRAKVIVQIDPQEIERLRREYSLGVGYRIRVRVILREKANALVVPRIAVLRERDSEYVVWVWDGRSARRRKVSVGLMNDDQAEILAGLKEGEKVLLTPEPSGT